jgi:dephospho-CoA kinase
MLRVGLTGGIACGKSRVLARLARHGSETLDLDVLAHGLMEPGRPAHREIVDAFGTRVLAADGTIDRPVLGGVVFGDSEARLRLNSILHPRIRLEEDRLASDAERAGAGTLVTSAALLVESGGHLRFDRLVVVHCPPETQLRRLMERDGLDEASARSRIDAQMPQAEKRGFAHFSLDAGGALGDTDAAADALEGELEALAATPPRRVQLDAARALGVLARNPSDGSGGLSPVALLREIAEAGGRIEMKRLARLVDPTFEGDWYHSPGVPPAVPGPEDLAGPIALWAVSRRGDDVDFLMAAAYSIAVLMTADPRRRAAACLYAVAVAELVLGGVVPADLSRFDGLVERWCGAPVAAGWRDALRERLESMARPHAPTRSEADLVELLTRAAGDKRADD